MLSKIKPHTEPWVVKLVKPISFIDPNIITIIGLIFPILFLYAMIQEKYILALSAIILSAFDMLDGTIARSTGKMTNFGGLLDSSLDRIADAIYITAFGFAGIISWWLVISLLINSYMISYIRSRAELAGKGEFKLEVGWIERPERVIFISAGVILLYLNFKHITYYLLLLLLLLSIITVFQRFLASYKLLKDLRK